MKKPFIFALIIIVFISGTASAQALNTITVDVGPTLVGAAFIRLMEEMADGEEGMSSSGFGIGVQYERDILETMSLALRVAYLGFGLGISFSEPGVSASAKTNFYSYSIEGHFRQYMLENKIFFIDGMLGYANMTMGIKGEAIITNDFGVREKESVSEKFIQDYIKYGAKAGLRIRFGGDSGFTFEPSFGYYGGVALGSSIGRKFVKRLGGTEDDAKELDEMFTVLADTIFVGGLRLSLAFGWSF